MRRQLLESVWLDQLRTGVWTVPLAMLPLAVLLNVAAGQLDEGANDLAWLRSWHLYSGSGDDARNLLSTLVTSIITMSSLVFSITVVTLSLASNQFGSRLVRIYLTDVRTKLALGTFTATVVYCLLALRSVHEAMTPREVPHVTVTIGLVLGMACVLILLFFLHVIARSIIADQVIRRVSEALEQQIDALPDAGADGAPATTSAAQPSPWPADFESRAVLLLSTDEGYVQAVDHKTLARIAEREALLVALTFKAGDFMCRQGWLGHVLAPQALAPQVQDELRGAVAIGKRRTATQDLEFSIRHLIDIALRALSPGINDTNTALVVIDRLRGAIARLLGKRLKIDVRHPGAWRLRFPEDHHGDVLDTAFNQIRQSATQNPAVLIRLLQAYAKLAEHVRTPAQRDTLLRHARMAAEAGRKATGGADREADREDVEAAWKTANTSLQRAPYGVAA
jgi:uncharacterized membrane protein